MDFVNRKIEPVIKKYLKTPEILAITGPRQSGKTTLLRKIHEQLKNSVFLSFEDRETLEFFETDIKNFGGRYKGYDYIFIDEFQYSKKGGQNLKYLFDTYQNKIIISGSSAIDLTVNAIKHLTGRIFVFHLYQLNWEEFLSYKDRQLYDIYTEYQKNIDLDKCRIKLPELSLPINKKFNKLLNEFITWGGYPRVVVTNDREEKRVVLKNIYNTYFLRDVRDTLGLIDDFKLSKLIKALALQIGQLIEYNELSKLSDYKYITLKKYINSLEKTSILKTIQPYYKNKRTEIVKNPKIYFFDTGLRNYIVNDFNSPEERMDKGELFENHIFTELTKKEKDFNYWRTKNKQEVDFIIKGEGEKILPLEVKAKTGKNKKESAGINKFINQYTPETALTTNLNTDPEAEQIYKKGKTNIYYIPNWMI